MWPTWSRSKQPLVRIIFSPAARHCWTRAASSFAERILLVMAKRDFTTETRRHGDTEKIHSYKKQNKKQIQNLRTTETPEPTSNRYRQIHHGDTKIAVIARDPHPITRKKRRVPGTPIDVI